MKTKKISIVTPVLNEIDSLPRYIEALNNFINSYGQGYIFEVIILDNNSTDNSYSYLKDKAQLDC